MRRPVVNASGNLDGRMIRRNTQALNRAVGALIEKLEDRRLLSVSVTNGILNIVGTSGPDNITVQYAAGGANTLRIKGQGFRQSVPAAGIVKININGEGGGDSITLSDAHGVLAIPAKIHGGPGNETVVGSSSGDDTLVGGNGHDMIQANGAGNILRGGSGPADTLIAGSADEIINGPGENLISTNNGASFTVSTTNPPKAIQLPAGIADTNAQLFSNGVVNPTVVGYTPEQVRTAYGLGLLNEPTTTNLGQGQTIAIVDPFDSTTVFNDLTVFSQQFGLPLPTAQNFEKVFAGGQQPGADADSDGEIDLDVEWAHAIAPDAKIILVEANTLTIADLFNAVAVAGNLVANSPAGGGVVSISFGFDEVPNTTSPGEASAEYTLDQEFAEFPTVSFVAAAGDTAGEISYPAMSPYVTSVGGTTVHLTPDGARSGATTAWADTGGGVSLNEPEPNYQSQALGTLGTLPNGNPARTGPDVAMLADPTTGVAVYNTTPNFPAGDSGWQEAGGTSLSAPLFGAIVALANQSRIADGQPVIGGNLNNAIYFVNTYFPGRDFSLGGATGYNERTGWGEPIPSNFIADLGTLALNGQTPPAYSVNVNSPEVSSITTLFGDLNAPVLGSGQVTDSYQGKNDGSATSTGPTTFSLVLNGIDTLQNAISLTVACTVTLTNSANDPFTGFLTGAAALFTSPALPVGQTLGIFFEGTVTPLSNQTSEISGDFYGAIQNADGSISRIGHNGVGGSGDGTVEGSFNG